MYKRRQILSLGYQPRQVMFNHWESNRSYKTFFSVCDI